MDVENTKKIEKLLQDIRNHCIHIKGDENGYHVTQIRSAASEIEKLIAPEKPAGKRMNWKAMG